MGAEQRRYPRLERPIDGRWEGASGLRHVRLTSLSLGGCFVDTIGRPSLGEPTRVDITFAGREPLALTGVVVYLDRISGFGVRFLPLTREQEEALATGLRVLGLADPYGAQTCDTKP